MTDISKVRVGLISDTHMPQRWPSLPPAIFEVFRGVDLILHAGDVGKLWVLDQLSAIAPVVAVHGNDDTVEAQTNLPYQQVITIGGKRIVLSHCHYPDHAEEMASRQGDDWDTLLERRAGFARRAEASIVVFGHTHIPMTRQYPMTRRNDSILLINPGAIGSGNATIRQLRQTVALLTISDGEQPAVTHYDLAAPDQLYEATVDWDAGLRAAFRRYEVSILSQDLAANMDPLWALAQQAFEPSYAALLRVSHRCWAGEQEFITRADLLAELRTQEDLPAEILAQFEAVLA